MVQDTLNPEYYVGAYQRPDGQWHTTKFSDPDLGELDSAGDLLSPPTVWERRPVVLVPVPGLSCWASCVPVADRRAAPSAPADPQIRNPADQPEPSPPQQQAARAQRPKRERSTDASQPLPGAADLELQGPDEIDGGRQRLPGPEPQPQLRELESEDSALDTDQAGDQGIPCPVPAGAAGPDGGEEDAARPRTRRREDAAAGVGAGAAAEAAAAPGGGGDGQAAGGLAGAAGAGAAAAVGGSSAEAVAEAAPAAEVPGSCIVYLYDHGICPRLHEVVQVIGVVSHMPQFATLEYDQYGTELGNELASLALGQGQPGAAAGLDGAGCAAGVEPGSLTDEAVRAAHPPTSKVMRIHAILVRRNLPLVGPTPPAAAPAAQALAPAPTPAAAPDAAAAAAASPADVRAAAAAPAPPAGAVGALRERALALLRLALGDDAVAAEYVLLQLLFRAAGRGEAAALGQLALNISSCPPGSATAAESVAAACANHSSPPLAADRLGCGPGALAAALQAAVGALVPLSVALPLTLDACNRVSWGPQRDTLRERTIPSPLQLAPGTVVVLDETVLAPGHLTEKGFKSFQALSAVARRQELLYDLEACQHPVPVDLPLIVLTEGRSLLRDATPLRVPLRATQPFCTPQAVMAAAEINTTAMTKSGEDTPMAIEAGGPAAAAPAPEAPGTADWATVRAYLAAARAEEDYELAEGMPAVLERYFVDSRRGADTAGDAVNNAAASAGNGPPAVAAVAAANGGMTPEEFHIKLTLARLMVLSHGERKLTRERWQQMLQLEHTREARLRVGA